MNAGMESMSAVTIGIGPGWSEVAHVAAERVRKMTGLNIMVIEQDPWGLHHPTWVKTRMWNLIPDHIDSIMYFDADFLPMKEFNPFALFHLAKRPFIAVPDVNSPPVERECHTFRIPYPDAYLNAGFFICGREHRYILENTYMHRYPECGSWWEQTGFNLELLKSGVDILRLPRKFNTLLLRRAEDDYSREGLRGHPAINLHATSFVGNAASIRQIQRDCWD